MRANCKTTFGFGDARLIRGRIEWRGKTPPITGIDSETIKAVQQRIVDVLDALLTMLLRTATLFGCGNEFGLEDQIHIWRILQNLENCNWKRGRRRFLCRLKSAASAPGEL